MLPIGALVFWAIRVPNYFDSEMFAFDVTPAISMFDTY